ncbi:hypothetical protein MY4824_007916 [Beauveria thailandica]
MKPSTDTHSELMVIDEDTEFPVALSTSSSPHDFNWAHMG